MTQDEIGTVLDRMRADAATLEHYGQKDAALRLREYARDLEKAAAPYTLRLSDAEALRWTGWSARTLASRFRELAAQGHAWEDERGRRTWRALLLPRRASADDVRARARTRATGGRAA